MFSLIKGLFVQANKLEEKRVLVVGPDGAGKTVADTIKADLREHGKVSEHPFVCQERQDQADDGFER